MACGASPRAADAPPSLLLARAAERVVELDLPPSSHPDGKPPDPVVPVRGPFELVRTLDGVRTWRAPLPFRPRNLFFSHAPPGMEVATRSGGRLRFVDGYRGDRTPGSWDYGPDALYLRTPPGEPAPREGDVLLRYPKAWQREVALNLRDSGLSERAFAFRSLQLGPDTWTGVFLPAPGLVRWEVPIPEGARLALRALILPPELDVGLASDGAKLEILLGPPGQARTVARRALEVGRWIDLDLPLDGSGETTPLTFRSLPGDSPVLDYVFVAEPVIYVPKEHPRRLLLVFIDTLRPDRMGMYGGERPTTPRLDAWAQGATVFTQARSVAPWTLPSTRTMLTGREPELWYAGERLQERLARAGWMTGAFVGNVYLSSNFDMGDGWTRHRCVRGPHAPDQVAAVEAFFEHQAGRDAFALLHLMDLHLPYWEPPPYRTLWAEEPAPGGLPRKILREDAIRAARKAPGAVRDYLLARYDQSLRYVDDALGDLLERLGDEVPVVLLADHGEEFWDHGGFEHGHTLYDELLHVPLVVRAPGRAGGRVETPVSLLDVAPTLYALAGVTPPDDLAGRSLLPLLGGARGALPRRELAFGRPLYGRERWGVLSGSLKYTVHQGMEEVYDVERDPDEQRPLDLPPERLEQLRAGIGRAMGSWSGVVWRLDPGRLGAPARRDVELHIRAPGGIGAAWLGADPLLVSDTRLEHRGDGEVVVRLAAGVPGSKEIYLRPADGRLDPTGLEVTAVTGGREERHVVEAADLPPVGARQPLDRWRAAGRTFRLTWAVAPVPLDEARSIEAFDPEVAAALQALGYVE